MSSPTTTARNVSSAATEPGSGDTPGRLFRLGTWAATHLRFVLLAWLLVLVGLGLFAPSVESHLSGAGWQANGSDSVRARGIIDRDFGGLSGTALQVVVTA